MDGTEAVACGSSGATCSACGGDQVCGNGVCGPIDGGATTDAGVDAGAVLDAGPSLRLFPSVASLGPGQWLALSAVVSPGLAGRPITWTAEGSATVSATGVVTQGDAGVTGESVITVCVGAGPCDSASILPGYTVSQLGRFCDDLTPCPSPFRCTSYASSSEGTGACSVTCRTDRGCAFGYVGTGDPMCPSGTGARSCALSCATSSCPGSMSCVDTNADQIPDTCVDFNPGSWPPVGEGGSCQSDGQCTFATHRCLSGTCQPKRCPDGAVEGDRCTLSVTGDGTCVPTPSRGLLCVLTGTSSDACSTVATRPETSARCLSGWLCVAAEGTMGTCQRACQGAADCDLGVEDCIVPLPQDPALQTCRPRPRPPVGCLASASLSLPFAYQEPQGSWGQRLRGGELTDLDGDGRAELLLPVPGVGGVAVIGAVPSSHALEVRARASGPVFWAVRAGDLRGDGVKELVGFDSTQASVLGAIDGGLGVVESVALVDGLELAVVADTDGDGRADLVAASAQTSTLVVRTSQPGGGFAPASSSALADGGAGHLLVEDCDGDGVKDVISIGPSVVSVFKGTPTGLGPRTDAPQDLGGPLATQLLADVNGDHRTDVVSRSSGSQVKVLLAQAGCHFSVTSSTLMADAQADGRPVAVLDTTGGGRGDLLVAGRDLGLDRFVGTAGGFSSTSEDLLPDVQDASGGPFTRPPNLAFFGAATVDGLGGPQVVRVAGSTVEVLGLGAAHLPRRVGAFGVGAVVGHARLNGDDVPDVVGQFGVTLSQLDGGWQDSTNLFGSPPLPDGGPGEALRAVGDLDGDGRLDLVAEVACGTAGAHVAMALGSGDGFFSPSASSTCVGAGTFRALLDWDGVNGLDVLCEGPQGVVPFLNDGAGGFTEDQPIGLFAEGPGLVADFDGDHRDDVIVETTTETSTRVLSVVFANRSSLIDLPPGFSLKGATLDGCGARPALLAVDLDHDGASELVAVLTGPTGDLLLLWRAATEALELRRLPARSGPRTTLAAGDLDGDGALDVAVGVAPPDGLPWSAPSAFIYFGDGAGRLGPPRGLGVDTFDESVALVDGDGDGRIDVLLPRANGAWSALAWPNRCP